MLKKSGRCILNFLPYFSSLLLFCFSAESQENNMLINYKGHNFHTEVSYQGDPSSDAEELQLKISLNTIIPYSYFTLQNPNRFVIDLEKSSIDKNSTLEVINSPIITQMRIGAEGSRVRLVLDLAGETQPDIKMRQTETNLVFTLNPANSKIAQRERTQVSVDTVWVSFASDEKRIQDIHVKNLGASAITLMGSVEKISFPGDGKENSKISDEVLISPQRLSLDAGEEKSVRILLSKKLRDTEENYRVIFNAEKAGERQTTSNNASAAGSHADLTIAIAALPPEAEPALHWDVKGNLLKLENLGKVSIFLDSGMLCSKEREICSSLPSRRMYPGNSWSMDVTGKSQAEFVQRSGEESQQLIIPLTITVNVPSAA